MAADICKMEIEPMVRRTLGYAVVLMAVTFGAGCANQPTPAIAPTPDMPRSNYHRPAYLDPQPYVDHVGHPDAAIVTNEQA